jgi:hypothetical protein
MKIEKSYGDIATRWHDSKRGDIFPEWGEALVKRREVLQVNDTRKTAKTSELSCQRGNIAATFYY